MAKSRLIRAYILGFSVLLLSFLLALKFGAATELDLAGITQLRLPRVLLAIAIGMGLSVAGAALQSLFANPLCEPYTLGVSSGSALGAVIGAALGWEWAFSGLASSAFVGALVFAFLLHWVAKKPGTGNVTILLTGVMLGFLGSSLVTVWLALSDINGIQGAMIWLFGDLSRARLHGSLFSLLTVGYLVFLVWIRWRDMDALLMGEEGALALGVDVASARKRLIVLTSLIIGLCVSGGGMIGFVGLIVPHFVRILAGSLHLNLIPLCAIWGAAALTIADMAARVIARPYELPVGVVTSLIGAPLFLWIMLQRHQEARSDG